MEEIWKQAANGKKNKTFGRFIYEVIRYATAPLQELQHVFTIIPAQFSVLGPYHSGQATTCVRFARRAVWLSEKWHPTRSQEEREEVNRIQK